MKYFVDSHAVEMVDIQKKKMFLKKSPCPPEISASDFVVGSKVYLYSRELNIVDYGDGTTKSILHRQASRCVAVISSDAYQDWGHIISLLEKEMNLVRVKTVLFSDIQADSLVSTLQVDPKNVAFMTRGTNLVLVFQSENGCDVMNNILTKEGFTQGVLVAKSAEQTAEINRMFLSLQTTATYDSCTCCIIRPHAVKEKSVGGILDLILKQGYEVSAIDSFQFDKRASEEFLELYKGVVPEYPDHVIQLCSGLSVCLELRAENAVKVFRETSGPWDIDMAKELRPQSIRGTFGVDKIRSAVHCTDLASDGQLECEYCFDIMSQEYN